MIVLEPLTVIVVGDLESFLIYDCLLVERTVLVLPPLAKFTRFIDFCGCSVFFSVDPLGSNEVGTDELEFDENLFFSVTVLFFLSVVRRFGSSGLSSSSGNGIVTCMMMLLSFSRFGREKRFLVGRTSSPSGSSSVIILFYSSVSVCTISSFSVVRQETSSDVLMSADERTFALSKVDEFRLT